MSQNKSDRGGEQGAGRRDQEERHAQDAAKKDNTAGGKEPGERKTGDAARGPKRAGRGEPDKKGGRGQRDFPLL